MAIGNLADNWRKIFSTPFSRNVFILTIVSLVVVLSLFARFLIFVEGRQGVVLDDPLFRHYTAWDFNTPIFIIIYGSLFTGAMALALNPRHLMLALQTYTVMVLFRFIAMYLMPLEVPEACINLRDPFVFRLGIGHVITKDLFFSGHVSSLTILFFTARNKYLKTIFLALTILLAVLIILQKNHYAIDVFAAPFFVFASYSIAKRIDERMYK